MHSLTSEYHPVQCQPCSQIADTHLRRVQDVSLIEDNAICCHFETTTISTQNQGTRYAFCMLTIDFGPGPCGYGDKPAGVNLTPFRPPRMALSPSQLTLQKRTYIIQQSLHSATKATRRCRAMSAAPGNFTPLVDKRQQQRLFYKRCCSIPPAKA